jgi:curved DNA-binding protein CbpA
MIKKNFSETDFKYFDLNSLSNEADLKKQYRSLAKKYHPDSGIDNQILFQEMNSEHQLISSEKLYLENIRKEKFKDINLNNVTNARSTRQTKETFETWQDFAKTNTSFFTKDANGKWAFTSEFEDIIKNARKHEDGSFSFTHKGKEYKVNKQPEAAKKTEETTKEAEKTAENFTKETKIATESETYKSKPNEKTGFEKRHFKENSSGSISPEVTPGNNNPSFKKTSGGTPPQHPSGKAVTTMSPDPPRGGNLKGLLIAGAVVAGAMIVSENQNSRNKNNKKKQELDETRKQSNIYTYSNGNLQTAKNITNFSKGHSTYTL